MTEMKTATLEVPGAVLTYDVRSPEIPDGQAPLLLIGSPMGAAGFATLAGHFTDRTVVTYDPRGVERSRLLPGSPAPTAHTHGDDLHRLVTELGAALGGGPVDVFASSGGAVNALAWVERHPGDVRTLVAHEPPVPRVLPDADAAYAAMDAIHRTYLAKGFGPAMAQFIALVSHEGPVPAGWADAPAPDPAMFGLPAEDDGSRDDPLLGANMSTLPAYVPDADAIRSALARVVLARGEQSGEQLAARSADAVAALLGGAPVVFPSDHGGFLGGEYGQTGEPDAFAARLREVLRLPAA